MILVDDSVRRQSGRGRAVSDLQRSDIRELQEQTTADDPTSTMQQQVQGWMNDLDGFNWGYDPWHYGVPEGSYASDPDGVARIYEYRQMVQGLADKGLRLVMDVVYNHTNAGGQSSRSVLDRVVPGYYHRYNENSGSIETSTCLQQHGHRVRDDGQADGGYAADLSGGLQGHRFPL